MHRAPPLLSECRCTVRIEWDGMFSGLAVAWRSQLGQERPLSAGRASLLRTVFTIRVHLRAHQCGVYMNALDQDLFAHGGLVHAAAPAAAPAAPPPPAAAPAPAAAPEAAAPEKSGSGVEMLAPMSGTVYRKPAPGEPQFVKEGDSVVVGQSVCIIEVRRARPRLLCRAVCVQYRGGAPHPLAYCVFDTFLWVLNLSAVRIDRARVRTLIGACAGDEANERD